MRHVKFKLQMLALKKRLLYDEAKIFGLVGSANLAHNKAIHHTPLCAIVYCTSKGKNEYNTLQCKTIQTRSDACVAVAKTNNS